MQFIRLDEKGTWKGTEHVSSFGADEFETFESGISCYSLKDVRWALESLHYYWFKEAMFKLNDFKDFQVTIFEGELIGQGASWEDTATCERTIKEFDAYDFMKKLDETIEKFEDEEITEEEYEEILDGLI